MSVHTPVEQAGQDGLVVFLEFPEGKLSEADKGLLSETSRLAGAMDVTWSVLAFSGPEQTAIEGITNYGAAGITLIELGQTPDCSYTRGLLLAGALKASGAQLVLLAHNDLGESLAPVASAQLDGALFTEAIALKIEGAILRMNRRVLGARVAEERLWRFNCPLVITLNLKVLSAVVLPTMKRCPLRVESWKPDAPIENGVSLVLERIPPDPQTVDVSEAEVIFSAGLGCNGESFEQLKELTRLLNVSLGVTRPMFDQGRTGFERMVGQTGRTVVPRLYLALGISGSMHHVGGIKDSGRIIAVNSDAKAPIFPNADEGYVSDLREVLPLLLDKVRAAVGGVS